MKAVGNLIALIFLPIFVIGLAVLAAYAFTIGLFASLTDHGIR